MEIRAVNLTKAFGDTVALDSLNLNIRGPGMIGYLGPNGAGKTTTLKLFTNLLFPSQGEALIDGVDVHNDPVRALRNVSALVETPEPYRYYTVREFLKFVAKVRGMDLKEAESRIRDLETTFHLDNTNRRIGKLSKGNKRKVMIAATLLPESKIILLDEPTDGLDPIESREVRNILNSLKRDRLIIMSSHLMYEVSETCDKLILINRGKMIMFEDTIHVVEKIGGSKVGASELEEAFFNLVGKGGFK